MSIFFHVITGDEHVEYVLTYNVNEHKQRLLNDL